MNKKNHQKKIIITIIILSILLINIPALSEKIIQANKNEEKIVTIKINKDINGYSATYLDITYSQTQRIIEKLRDLKIKLNQKQINDLTYINDFIKIFQEEKILPNEINLNSLLQIHNSIYTNISSLQLENPISKKENNYILNNDFPIHIGRNTITYNTN
jgi:hypothetical protein